MIPIYKPYLPKEILKYAHQALDSGWLSHRGKYIELVQEKMCEEFGVKYALLTANGTFATHLLAKCLKYKHPNIKKIIAPNNVYVAAWNSFLYDNYDWNLELIDADLNTWNADYDSCIVDKDTAILLAHNVGNIVNIEKIKNKFPDSVIVEDSCEGFFGKYGKYRAGSQSLCSSFSFFANKDITCGEGGMFLTSDKNLYEYAKHISSQSQTEKIYIHDQLGYNFRMTNIQAAVLYGQLEILDYIKTKKRDIFKTYQNYLSDIPGIEFQKSDLDTEHSNWMISIRIHNSSGYESAKEYFNIRGVEIRPMFYPASFHKHIANSKNIMIQKEDNARLLSKECIFLPSYPQLTKKQISYISDVVRDYKKICG